MQALYPRQTGRVPLLRYFAALRAEAGVAEEERAGSTLAEVLAAARAGRDDRFAQVLSVCSFLVDGDPVGTRAHDGVALAPGSSVDCLPPYAGG
jgi:molybdopterin converting factor small subunit